MTIPDRYVDVGVRLHLRQWPGEREPFLLVHGLASNARTWDEVATRLSEGGHPVVAVDQRGHGLSDKPATGYDFETVTGDLVRLIGALGWDRPIVVGQSWGGNVALELGARHPGLTRGLGFVDGGFIALQSRPGGSWEQVSRDLQPPPLAGTPRTGIERYLRAAHRGWSRAGIEATLANFETLPDGTVRPWLARENHMTILRALWEQRVSDLFPGVREPVVLCVAGDRRGTARGRGEQIAAAQRTLPRVTVRWFPDTDHDIHVHRPKRLARLFLEQARTGIWAGPGMRRRGE